MEFMPPRIISRYDAHPGPKPQYAPNSYNPAFASHGMKYAPKLSPQIMGSPTMKMMNAEEREATRGQVWHKGGYPINTPPAGSKTRQPFNNPFEAVSTGAAFGARLMAAAGAGGSVAPSTEEPMVTRGGWPAGGQYSRVSGNWWTTNEPIKPPKAAPSAQTYKWQHANFVNTSPLGADGRGFK